MKNVVSYKRVLTVFQSSVRKANSLFEVTGMSNSVSASQV